MITDFRALQVPLERIFTAVRGNVVFETLHDFYRTAIINYIGYGQHDHLLWAIVFFRKDKKGSA